MIFRVCAVLTILVVATSATPGIVHQPLPAAQGEFNFPSAPLQIPTSHAPLTLPQAALAVSHAPIALPQPALQVSHTPVISAAPIAHAPIAVAQQTEYNAPANYEFQYGVHDSQTHDFKEQAEKRVGDKVEGYYRLVEPDGTTRTVHYTADHQNGFNAVVEKSGQSAHPATVVQQQAVPVLKSVVSAPAVSYSHAPSYSDDSSYSNYGSAYASNYGHGLQLGSSGSHY